VIPSRPPLSETRSGWLWVQAGGAGLLAIVHVVLCLSEGVLGLPPLRARDPERLFQAMTVCYAAGGWLLSWPEPGTPESGWRAAGRRWGLRLFSLAAVMAAWLMWASWNYVSWWNYGRYRAAAAETLALAIVGEWLIFDHLGRLAPGTALPGLYFHFRAARYAASFTVIALAFGNTQALYEGLWHQDMGYICFPAELIVLVYPSVLIAGFVPVLISSARAARRKARFGPAVTVADTPSNDA
jgi:hypothetical protein